MEWPYGYGWVDERPARNADAVRPGGRAASAFVGWQTDHGDPVSKQGTSAPASMPVIRTSV